MLHLFEETILLGPHFPTFPLARYSWDSELNTLTSAYSSLDQSTSSAKAQGSRPNIQFWALIPTIAPQNSGFSLLSEEKKWGFDLLRVKVIHFFGLHVWEYHFACPITVTDTSELAMRH